MKLGSLFDGISGFPLAASWAGIETKWISEIDEYCLKISKKNFPNAIQYGNIKELFNPEPVDIICGGFPCQPFSVAGKQSGKSDNRYLWPEMLRIIREVKPRWVVGENVYGLVNWNGGLAFDEVQTDLENEGYQVQPAILPACSVNAPHRRERIWFIAYSNSKPRKSEIRERQVKRQEREQIWSNASTIIESWNVANSNSKLSQGGGQFDQIRKGNQTHWLITLQKQLGKLPNSTPNL